MAGNTIGDISLYNTSNYKGTDAIKKNNTTKKPETTNRTIGDNTLDMDDFMKLLAAQLQNQDMMNPMDESQFMNQMAQMATVQAMNTFTDVAITSYAASLVGKEITVAETGNDGAIKEVVGTVTAAGLYGGKQIVFVNDKSYYLPQIMAIGKLPKQEVDSKNDGNTVNKLSDSENETKPANAL